VPTYVITTGSDPVAYTLLEVLKDKGFSVFDESLAETSTLMVLNTTSTKLKKAVKIAKDDGLLLPPYNIKFTEVRFSEGRSYFKDTKGFKMRF